MESKKLLATASALALLLAVAFSGAALAQASNPGTSAGGSTESFAGPISSATTGTYGIFVAGPNPTPAFGGTTINFEGRTEGELIDNQYNSLGVTFSQDDAGRPQIDNSPFLFAFESRSGAGVLTGSTEGGAPFPTVAGLVAEFDKPVTKAGAFISDTDALGNYTVTIYDASGSLLDTVGIDLADFPYLTDTGCDATSPWEGSGCGVWVGFDVGTPAISKIQFGRSSSSGDAFAIDDLVFVEGPDLVVDSLTHFPATPDTEDTIQFTAVVRNIGDQAAGASTLCFEIGGESCTLQPDDTLFAIPALAPGATANVVRNEGLSTPASYINTAVADFGGDVAESDESNNTATDSYTVSLAEEVSGTVYSIVTAPTNGDLYEEVDTAGDPVGSPLTDGSPIADPESLHYFPDPGFEGTDMFTYRCTDTATLLFDDAVVDIIVSSAGTGVTLTVNFLGNGSGDVTFDVANTVVALCSADCVEDFGPNDIVKLQARPLGLDTFGTWGGDCSSGGSSQIVTITMDSSKTCSATFNP